MNQLNSPGTSQAWLKSIASFVEYSLNVFTEFAEFSDKNNTILKEGLQLTISCVR